MGSHSKYANSFAIQINVAADCSPLLVPSEQDAAVLVNSDGTVSRDLSTLRIGDSLALCFSRELLNMVEYLLAGISQRAVIM